MPKSALITGITGQDGSYLAELLIGKGYVVHGLIRRSSNFNTQRIEHIYQDPHKKDIKLKLHYGDMLDLNNIRSLLEEINPDEIYNLAAQSHVRVSFDLPIYTSEVVAIGTAKLLEAIRQYQKGIDKIIKFYQASSSEIFGNSPPPQSEVTAFQPCSPYAISKLYAYWMTVNYREAYGLHASNGVLFNHEGPRRSPTFVTRKITMAIARILQGRQQELFLGNLEAKRDWGYAGDFIKAMWMMLQQKEPDDYVIGTGEAHSVQEFLEAAFNCVGLDWKNYVKIDKKYYRPTEVDCLIADSTKARTVLGWQPKVNFDDLVKLMVEHDLKAIGIQFP